MLTILLVQLLADAGHEGPPHAARAGPPRRGPDARARGCAHPARTVDRPPPARLTVHARRATVSAPMDAPDGIPGSVLTGPFPSATTRPR